MLRNITPNINCINLAEVIGFEPMILISKTSALGQTKLYPNKILGDAWENRTPVFG